jgi:hypothetical protein
VYNIFGLLYFLNKLSKDWVGSSSYFNTLTRPPPAPTSSVCVYVYVDWEDSRGIYSITKCSKIQNNIWLKIK